MIFKKKELRSTKRFPMRLIFLRKPEDGSAPKEFGVTKDVSAGGVYFYTREAVVVGSEITVIVQLPPELTAPGGAKEVWALCRASILRIDAIPDGSSGVGASINHYEILGES